MIRWIVFPTNDGAGGAFGHEQLFDVSGECRAVHRALDDEPLLRHCFKHNGERARSWPLRPARR